MSGRGAKPYVGRDAPAVWKFPLDERREELNIQADAKWAKLMGDQRYADFIPARLR